MCLRTPERTPVRQVVFYQGKLANEPIAYAARMREALDSPRGRALYGERLGIVEPVFANIRHNKGFTRFTLRGQKKVNAQFQLICTVHNIEKTARYGTLAPR